MQLLNPSRTHSNKKKKNARRPEGRRSYMEAMESRTLLSAVLGGVPLDANGPLINIAGGTTTYTAATGVLDVVALAPSFQLPPYASSPSNTITNPPYAGGLVTLDIQLNNSGQFVQNQTNLQITGTSGSFTSGVLLAGTATSFSFDGTGRQMQIGITFQATGGDLAPFFGPDQVAMVLTVEGSTFAGSFASDFTGGAKGNVGGIPGGSGSPPAGLGDYVWNDLNHDGVQQANEPGINNVLVTLLDGSGNPLGPTQLTHNNGVNDGFYSFTGLTPGSYEVKFTLPSGYTFTQAFQGGNTALDSNANTTTGVSDVVTLAAGQFNPTIDAGLIQTAGLGDYVWNDLNHNGIQDANETGVNGVTVTLLDGSGNSTGKTTVTATNGATQGYYSFTNLIPGSYEVKFTLPSGYSFTSQFQGSDTTVDSNANTATGIAPSVTLAPGQFNPTIDAGIYQNPNISGTKYKDLTGNGLTSDDTPLAGVTVKLYIDVNGDGVVNSGDTLVATTVTGADGKYYFALTSATTKNYLVQEVIPAGYIRTFPYFSDTYAVCANSSSNITGLNFANYQQVCNLSEITNVSFKASNCSTTYTDLRGNTSQGQTITVKFTLADTDTLSLVSYVAPDNYFNADHAFAQEVYQISSQTFGPGTHTLTVTIPCCYYQIDFVCGPVIDQLGPAGSNIFYSAQARLISADNGGTTAPNFGQGSLSGTVFVNTNGQANYQTSDVELAGIVVTLTGHDNVTGLTITRTTVTDANGDYYFADLDAGTYKITEGATVGHTDGTDYLGTLGGTLGNDTFSNIVVKAGQDGFNYNFGEKT